ncbi:MAG: hypothetical protein VB066_10585 [Paludibacter sp.]|nr:hypothetical protein [Paludibacter sp.]
MKKIFIIITIQAIIFSSCDKQEVGLRTKQNADRDLVINKSLKLSEDHDSLLTKMLRKEKQVVRQKAKNLSKDARLEMNEIFDVIEEVAGVRPHVVASSDEIKQLSKASGAGENTPVFNFDDENISLSEYSNSAAIRRYLERVDLILKDSLNNVQDQILRISAVQEEVKQDPFLDNADLENFFNTTEVLKGSMMLWNNHYQGIQAKQDAKSMLKAKPLKQWSFFAKLGFVAAADAVGAVLGTFVGGFLIVNGVPIYIPSGPQGACVGLATLSLIAGNMVGW